jgi:hypothetical protein
MGNVLVLNALDGTCLHDISCPVGGIYGGVTILHDKILFSCGYTGIFSDHDVDMLIKGKHVVVGKIS